MGESLAGFELDEVGGVPLFHRRDDRFKTFRVVLCAQRPLQGPTAARALLPSLLVAGTARHADRPAIVRALDRLYGTHVSPAVGRFGETAVLRFSADAVAGEFLPERPDQWGGALEMLGDFALRPRLQDGAFRTEVFEMERKQAVDAARALADDKGAWARQRALEIACTGEPYGVPDHGGEAALLALTKGEPEAARVDFLARGRLWAFAMGVLPADLKGALEALVGALPPRDPEPVPPPVVPDRRPARTTVEFTALQQSKQLLVLRCNLPSSPAQSCTLHTVINLWGGGPHSRLFREVREKRSLAYYASAGGDLHKGLLLVQIGLDAAAATAARDEAMAQLAAIARGDFTDEELRTSVATQVGPLLSVDDSLLGRMQFTADQWLSGLGQTPEERIAQYRAVGRDAVAAEAQAIWLDHDYLLRPEEGNP